MIEDSVKYRQLAAIRFTEKTIEGVNILTLQEPGAVPADVVKIDHDLHVHFDGEETLVLRDFYLLGGSGEYSLLMDYSGAPIASGLSAPDLALLEPVSTPAVAAAAPSEILQPEPYDAVVTSNSLSLDETSGMEAGHFGGVPLWATVGGAFWLGVEGLEDTDSSVAANDPTAEAGKVSTEAAPELTLGDLSQAADGATGAHVLEAALIQELPFPLIAELGEAL